MLRGWTTMYYNLIYYLDISSDNHIWLEPHYLLYYVVPRPILSSETMVVHCTMYTVQCALYSVHGYSLSTVCLCVLFCLYVSVSQRHRAIALYREKLGKLSPALFAMY